MTSQSLVVNVNGQQRSLTHTELVTIGLSCLSVSIRSNAHGGKMMTDKEIWTLAGRARVDQGRSQEKGNYAMNAPQKITGYRELSANEVKMINQVKAKANEVRSLIFEIEKSVGTDIRWLDIAETDLQKGFMSLVRAIAQPDSF